MMTHWNDSGRNLGWLVSAPDGTSWMVISAPTRGRAKVHYAGYDILDGDSFLSIRAVRFPQADGKPEGEVLGWEWCEGCERIVRAEGGRQAGRWRDFYCRECAS